MSQTSLNRTKVSSKALLKQMAGVAVSYDVGDSDSIFNKKERPEYLSSNSAYGAAIPLPEFSESNEYGPQRLKEILEETDLIRKSSELDISIAEELLSPQHINTKNPHAAPKFNRDLREQAAALRLQDLRRLKAEEYKKRIELVQSKLEYRGHLEQQMKLHGVPTYEIGSLGNLQPNFKRKFPKSFNPLLGEPTEYSDYSNIFSMKPAQSSPLTMPYSYKTDKPSLQQSQANESMNATDADEKPEQVGRKDLPNKLARYGKYAMSNASLAPAYTLKSGLGYKPTRYLIC
jgi:hypothetical protein